MRTKIGLLLAIVGVLVAIFGAVVMIVLGPDSQITTGPKEIETRDSVAVTAPKMLSWRGAKVTVLAEVPAQKPVFVGIGKQRDTSDYVGSIDRIELESLSPASSKARKGKEDELDAAPTAVDWWLTSASGVGGARIEVTLPDQPAQIVVASLGSSNLSGLEVTVAYGVAGGFASGAGLVFAGIGLVLWGLLLWRGWSPSWRSRPKHDHEEVTYVYADDDGIEHEVDEAQARKLGLFDDDVEIVDESQAGQ